MRYFFWIGGFAAFIAAMIGVVFLVFSFSNKPPQEKRKEIVFHDSELNSPFFGLMQGDPREMPPLERTILQDFLSSYNTKMGAVRTVGQLNNIEAGYSTLYLPHSTPIDDEFIKNIDALKDWVDSGGNLIVEYSASNEDEQYALFLDLLGVSLEWIDYSLAKENTQTVSVGSSKLTLFLPIYDENSVLLKPSKSISNRLKVTVPIDLKEYTEANSNSSKAALYALLSYEHGDGTISFVPKGLFTGSYMQDTTVTMENLTQTLDVRKYNLNMNDNAALLWYLALSIEDRGYKESSDVADIYILKRLKGLNANYEWEDFIPSTLTNFILLFILFSGLLIWRKAVREGPLHPAKNAHAIRASFREDAFEASIEHRPGFFDLLSATAVFHLHHRHLSELLLPMQKQLDIQLERFFPSLESNEARYHALGALLKIESNTIKEVLSPVNEKISFKKFLYYTKVLSKIRKHFLKFRPSFTSLH